MTGFFGGAAVAAIVCGEILGRGRALYSRLGSTVGLFFIFVLVSLARVPASSGESRVLLRLVHDLLSGFIVLGAWFGLSVHLSNSITLRMLELIGSGEDTRRRLEKAYDRKGRIEKRLEVLERSSYITAGPERELSRGLKTGLILWALRLLR